MFRASCLSVTPRQASGPMSAGRRELVTIKHCPQLNGEYMRAKNKAWEISAGWRLEFEKSKQHTLWDVHLLHDNRRPLDNIIGTDIYSTCTSVEDENACPVLLVLEYEDNRWGECVSI